MPLIDSQRLITGWEHSQDEHPQASTTRETGQPWPSRCELSNRQPFFGFPKLNMRRVSNPRYLVLYRFTDTQKAVQKTAVVSAYGWHLAIVMAIWVIINCRQQDRTLSKASKSVNGTSWRFDSCNFASCYIGRSSCTMSQIAAISPRRTFSSKGNSEIVNERSN